MPGLLVVEKNQVSSLTKSTGSTWVRTSLSLVSHCLCIAACWSSCLSASFSFHLVASSWNWSIILSISFSTLAHILPISLLWLAICSSSFASCLCCSQSSSHFSWDFAWVTTCSCYECIPWWVCKPPSLQVLRDVAGTRSGTIFDEDSHWHNILAPHFLTRTSDEVNSGLAPHFWVDQLGKMSLRHHMEMESTQARDLIDGHPLIYREWWD